MGTSGRPTQYVHRQTDLFTNTTGVIINGEIFVQVLLWLCTFCLAVYAEFGAVFVLTSGFAAIWLNLGRNRGRRGAPSAYSVFNPGVESIDGTLKGEQLDQQIR